MLKVLLFLIFLPLFAEAGDDALALKQSLIEITKMLKERPDLTCDGVVDRTIGSGTLKDSYAYEFEVSDVSLDYLNELFQKVSQQEQLGFRHPEEGCYARATAMALFLEKDGIKVGKAYIEGKELEVKTKNVPEGKVTWDYHVAPVILVKGRPYIIDPSLFDRPVKYEDWKNTIIKTNPKQEIQEHFENRFSQLMAFGMVRNTKYDKEMLKQESETLKKSMKEQVAREAGEDLKLLKKEFQAPSN